MKDRPVAIVTGASRGIGRGIAQALASLGFDLVVNYFDFTPDGKPDNSKAEQTQIEIVDLNAKCEILRGDVSSAADRDSLVACTKRKFPSDLFGLLIQARCLHIPARPDGENIA